MNERGARLADFDSRAQAQPNDVFCDPHLGRYIAIHPMADEVEVLHGLGISAASCTKVDCYWEFEDDVYFLQVEARAHASRMPGLWVRLAPGEPSYMNVVGVVDEDVVTRETVHRVMRTFRRARVHDVQLTETLVRLDIQIE